MPQEEPRHHRPRSCRVAQPRTFRTLSSVIIFLVGSVLLTAFFPADSPGLTAGKDLSLWWAMPESSKLLQKDIESRMKAVEGNDGLDKEIKKRLLSVYQQAQSYLAAADSYEQRAAVFEQSVKATPAEVAEVHRKIEEAQKTLGTAPAEDLSHVSLADLDFKLTVARAESDALRGDLDSMDNALQEQKGRPAQIRDELKAAREALNETEREATMLRSSQQPPMLVEARRIVLTAARRARIQEIHMLNRELFSYGPRLQLFAAQRDLMSLALARAEIQVNVLREAVTARQRADAEKSSAETLAAEKAASGKHAVLVDLLQENAILAEELNSVANEESEAVEVRSRMRDELRREERDYRETRQKVEVAGRSRALGHLLVEEYRNLPDAEQYKAKVKTTRRKIEAVSLRLLEIEESIKSPAEVGLQAEEVLQRDVGETITDQQKRAVENEARRLLTERQTVLRKLADAYTSYLDTLSDLDNRQREMIETLGKHRALLDEWILWVPSTTPLGKSTLEELRDLESLYASASRWKEIGLVMWADLARAPQVVTLLTLFFLLLLWGRRRLRKKFAQIEQLVENPETDHFALTLSGFLVTVLLSLPLPLLFAVLGWRLEEAPESTQFAQAVGSGLSVLVYPTLYLRIFYHFCSANGLAVVHFKWTEQAARLLRRHTLWYTLLFLPLVFNIAVSWKLEESLRSHGRMLSFIAVMCASALFLQRVLRPRGGAVERYLAQHPDGWLSRLRNVWYLAAVCTPIALVGLSASGYLYTAVVLSGHVIRSFWLILASLVLHEVVVRWLRLSQRRLAPERGEDSPGGEVTGESGGDAGQPEPHGSLPDAGAQTLRMFHFLIGFGLVAGLLMVWSDILPALSILQEVKLWRHTAMIDGKEVQQPFTLWSFAVIGILVAVTIALWRNLPGVIDLALLQRLRLSEASRYATRRIIRYSIVTVGLIAVFKSVGAEWSQIQWLIAALGVGLGFGLQEIVANFISGIIILFEQPIRVGDVVTIGQVSGRVTRIQIRATTVTDFDNKELIVPNKNFITGELVNWTRTEPVTRITLKVGIAYGSDTALAHRTMLETVKANRRVLENPEPRVLFTAFGDSSLDFDVHVFVKEIADRLPVTHDLHMAIERALREQGIEIPFPQRDIHVRTLPPSAMAEGPGKAKEV